jgi:hypothetical protein
VRSSVSAKRATTVPTAQRERGLAALVRERGHPHAVQPARDRPLERPHVVVDVDREAMRRDPALDVHADRGDLALLHPHAGVLDPVLWAVAGGDPLVGERRDERRLDPAQVRDHVVDADDRVADELARAVIGELAAAVDRDDVDPLLGVPRGRERQVAVLRAPPARVHGRVLKQQQHVGQLVGLAAGAHRLLQRERRAVLDEPEAHHQQLAFLRGGGNHVPCIMPVAPVRPLLAVLAASAALLAGCGSSGEERGLPRGAEPVELDPAGFSTAIDNPWWPMRPGSRWVYREGAQRVEVTVLRRTRRIANGIEARVVHDVVSEGGDVVEDTYDWYAQDGDGNVWYLGEDTTEYEDGRPASTAGSWEAGVDGAQAGIAMPAEPAVGLRYRQEHYAGEAEDRAAVLSLDEQVDVPFGHFDGVLMTKDFTPVEPDVLEHKLYAKGVGPVLTLAISGGRGREELVAYER